MSMSVVVYCNSISKELLPLMLKRLNDYDMKVEIHPKFKFDEEEDDGFLPFKFQLINPKLNILKNKILKSGFELYFDEFDLNEIKNENQPKLSFLDKLLKRKNEEYIFAPKSIETKLLDCKKEISFVFHTNDTFEFRFALLTSAILAELTNGLVYYPEDDSWLNYEEALKLSLKEIKEYEDTLEESDILLHEFDEW